MTRRVLAFDGSTTSVYADLRELACGPINDMVVDVSGRAYVTQLGFDLFAGEVPKESPIMVVEPDGSACIADEAGPPMGAHRLAVTPDGAPVVPARTFVNRSNPVDIRADGCPDRPRTFLGQGPA